MSAATEEPRHDEEETAKLPVSTAVLWRAQESVRRFPGCFWFWHPEAKVVNRRDVLEVVHNLREYGGKEGWHEASALLRCL